MTHESQPIEFLGAPGSPYTRKMLALLRYRRIPHVIRWGSHRSDGVAKGYPEPKVKLLPTFYFPTGDGELDAVVDSTPIIRRLEAMQAARSVIPADPAAGFLNDLVEDFADEWLTKAMFHYRWHHQRDADNAGPLLVFWQDPGLEDDIARTQAEAIARRQIDRLYVVGSSDKTATIIEESYERLVEILDRLVQTDGFAFGARPASADFALYGQMTQLALVDPTPAEIVAQRSKRLRAWIDRVDDLSGLEPDPADWAHPDALAETLLPLLHEIGRVYTPVLVANARAAQAGEANFETEIHGQAWAQPTFPYQAKCLAVLRAAHAGLPADARARVDRILSGTGCERIFA